MPDNIGTERKYGEGFRGGADNINKNGRPPKSDFDKKGKTNRELREQAFLELVRKFRPLQTKAIQAAVNILDNNQAADQNKLKASALIISTYKSLLAEVYDYRYDEEEAEAMQEANGNQAVFSLRVLEDKEDKQD